jgi:SNF2 family DNA or RNA helicase
MSFFGYAMPALSAFFGGDGSGDPPPAAVAAAYPGQPSSTSSIHVVISIGDTTQFSVSVMDSETYFVYDQLGGARVPVVANRSGSALVDPLFEAQYGKSFRKVMREHGGYTFLEASNQFRLNNENYDRFEAAMQTAAQDIGSIRLHSIDVSDWRRLTIIAMNERESKNPENCTAEHLISKNVPPKIANTLAPFQREGVSFCIRNDGRAFIADEMGLGKTIQSIAVMASYSDTDWPVMVVTPSSARYHWEAEFLQWCGSEKMKGAKEIKQQQKKRALKKVGGRSCGLKDWSEDEEDSDDSSEEEQRGAGNGGNYSDSSSSLSPPKKKPREQEVLDLTHLDDSSSSDDSMSDVDGIVGVAETPSVKTETTTSASRVTPVDTASSSAPPQPNPLVLQPHEIKVMTSTKDTWEPHHKVVIVSFGLITLLCKSEKIVPGVFRSIIVDESHYVKNPGAQRTKYLVPLLCAAKRRVLLSGTPAFAKPEELFPQVYSISYPDPDSAKEPDFRDPFLNNGLYCEKYSRGKWGDDEKNKHNMVILHRNLGAFMIRRYKADILKDLKGKLRLIVRQRCNDQKLMKQITEDLKIMLTQSKGRMAKIGKELAAAEIRANSIRWYQVKADIKKLCSAEEQRLREAQEDRLNEEAGKMVEDAADDDDDDDVDIAAVIDKMKKEGDKADKEALADFEDKLKEEAETFVWRKKAIIDHPSLVAEKKQQYDPEELRKVLMKLYKRTGKSKIPIAIKHVKDMFSKNSIDRNMKLCIFAHHLDVLEGIEQGALQNIKHIRIDGSTPPKRRQELVTQFQNDDSTKVALLGITAAGVAITLTAASRVLFAELYWTPAMLHQCEDRCHRIGQQSVVKAKYLITKNTLDEILWELARQKFHSISQFVEGQMDRNIVVDGDKKAGKPAYSWLEKSKEGIGSDDEDAAVASERSDGDDDGDEGGDDGDISGLAGLLEDDLAAIADLEEDAAEKDRKDAGDDEEADEAEDSVRVRLGAFAGELEEDEEKEVDEKEDAPSFAAVGRTSATTTTTTKTSTTTTSSFAAAVAQAAHPESEEKPAEKLTERKSRPVEDYKDTSRDDSGDEGSGEGGGMGSQDWPIELD